MPDADFRFVVAADIPELVAIRRDFTFEDAESASGVEVDPYEAECRAFLERAIGFDTPDDPLVWAPA